MAYENDILTRNDDDELSVRVVQSTGDNPAVAYDDVYTRDDNGKLAVRVVGAGGGDTHNKGYFATPEALRTAYPTAQPGDFAIVESTDTVWVWDSDTSDWKDSDTKGQVTSVNGQTGAVTVDAGQTIQYDTMPTASAETVGKTIQYTGTTSDNYTNGCFYRGYSYQSGGQTYYGWGYTTPTINVNTAGDFVFIGKGANSISGSVYYNIAIGKDAKANGYAVAIGKGASCVNGVAIGEGAKATGDSGCIQLGFGTNSTNYTFQVRNYRLLNADGTIPKERLTNVVTTPSTAPVLAVADWSSNTQTITVTGVTATNTVFVAPAPASAADYAAAGILCTAQAADSLTFTCTTVPSNAITLSVVILG